MKTENQNAVKAMIVTLLADRNFPIKAVRVTSEQGEFDKLGDLQALLKKTRELNPELGIDGLVQGIIRAGITAVVGQIEKKKLDAFLKTRRG